MANEADVASAQSSYEAANRIDGSLIRTGLMPDDVRPALADSRTIYAAGTSVKVPLAVPLDAQSVLRREYFIGQSDIEKEKLYGYVGSAALMEVLGLDPIETTRALADQLAEREGLLVYEQSVERDVARIFRDALAGYRRKATTHSFETEHHGKLVLPNHYLYEIRFSGTDNRGRGTLYDAAQRVIGSQVELVPELANDEIEKTYTDYGEAFATATRHSPIHEVLSFEHFQEAMSDDRYWKMVLRDEEGISNLSMMCPIELLPWMNEAAIRQRYPQEYEAARVLGGPIIYSRPGSGPEQSLTVMQFVSELFEQCGRDYLVIAETHYLSRWLAQQMSLPPRPGSTARISVSDPILEQTVEALSVK